MNLAVTANCSAQDLRAGAERPDKATYLLANSGSESRARFAALSALFDPATIGHLVQCGVSPGWRCLEVGAGGVATETYELLVGLLEFGLANSIREIVTVTDTRMERILRRANWPLRRLGEPVQIGDTRALAGSVEISDDILHRLRSRGGFTGPLLMNPILSPAWRA